MTVRHNYEAIQVLICVAGSIALLSLGVSGALPEAIAYIAAGVLGIASLAKLKPAWDRLAFQIRLLAPPKAWITHSGFCRKVASHKDKVFLGAGFPWGSEQAKHLYEVTQRQNKEQLLNLARKHLAWAVFFAKNPATCMLHPIQAFHLYADFKRGLDAKKGDPFMHALEKSSDVMLDRANFSQNALIVGATGSGKTRVFDSLTGQAILAGDCTVMIDPKGDPGFRDNLVLSAKAANRDAQVVVVDLAQAEQSVGYNPLADLTPPSRAGALVGQAMGGKHSEFKDFGIQVMSTAAEGIALLGKAVTLKRIRRAIDDRQRFAVAVLKAYMTNTYGKESLASLSEAGVSIERQLSQLVDLYRAQGTYKPEVDAVIELGEHDAEHFSKMITTTLLHLQRLTNGAIGDLLSPEEDSRKMFLDARKIREKKLIVLFALGAMLDKTTCSAVGSLILASLVSLAGGIYSYGDKTKISPVTMIVDEASEVMSDSFLQLLAEGRAAGFNNILATQTVVDFAAKGSSPADGLRVLANVNNIIALRCNDPETQRLLSDKFGKTVIKVVNQSQGIQRETGHLIAQAGSMSERETEKELDLVSPVCLGSLPDCEFFAMVQGGKIFKCRSPIIVEKASDYHGV